MNLVERVQAILLRPGETWPVIEAEAGDIPSITRNYLVYLAAVPAVAGFIGMSLVGMGLFGVSFRVPILSGLVNMVVGFVLSLAMVYGLALVADALAPTFKGQKNLLNAFKLVAYSATAAMAGGIFNLLPSLSMLGLLAGLYSIYLLFTGIPVLMKAPADKALGYTAVLIVCGIVAGLIIGAVTSLFTGGGPGMHMRTFGSAREVEIQAPGAQVSINSAELKDAGKTMEEASKRLESAQASGDTAAANKAMSEMMGAMTGAGQGGQPFSPDILRTFMPTQVGAMNRTAIEARTDAALGMSFSSVTAEFRNDAGRLEVKVQDVGTMPALMMTMGAWAQSAVSRETQDEVEKVYRQHGMSIKEAYRKDGSRAEMSMLLGNGVLIEVSGDNVNMAGVRAAVDALDIKGLSDLQRKK